MRRIFTKQDKSNPAIRSMDVAYVFALWLFTVELWFAWKCWHLEIRIGPLGFFVHGLPGCFRKFRVIHDRWFWQFRAVRRRMAREPEFKKGIMDALDSLR